MQAVIALPHSGSFGTNADFEEALTRKVCGVPLLARTLLTATRSGATQVLLLIPPDFPAGVLERQLAAFGRKIAPLERVSLHEPFNPARPADWLALRGQLEPAFLWLPWNLVTDKRRLETLLEAGHRAGAGAQFDWPAASETPKQTTPLLVIRDQFVAMTTAVQTVQAGPLEEYATQANFALAPLPSPPGVIGTDARTAHQAEEDLVRWSGKHWDGIYSRFNRRLCWPIVRVLARTPVTPNAVTVSGLLFVLLAGLFYAEGHYLAYVAGGLFYFLSVLFDEIDGMLARVTFRDSPFGCWLESFVDSVSFVILFAGITIGLYRQSGPFWLAVGAVLMVSVVLSLTVVNYQRTLATEADRPEQYLIRLYASLEKESHNWVSRQARQVQFLMKKAVFAHHLLWLSVLGFLKFHYLMCTLGALLTWTLALYHNRLFRVVPQAAAAVSESSRVLSADRMKGEA